MKDVEVTAVNDSIGDYVNAGDTIVTLDSSALSDELTTAQDTYSLEETKTNKTVADAIGIILGLTLGSIATKMLGYAAKASVASIVFSVVFSIFIGVFFGYYPANKAAKLNPIEALRYE